ncbi:MAG: hypothetical protein ABS81_09265 [Pseudonocardia sp. SCN 72-86]|uniref:LysR family transcriptional regulator n=1 Tax=uncultured Microbacterium sp. TaxID=191216 RepID=UPI00086D22B9|nr:LysR family transcriptional regulator [uncultured Microbacterium sp.]ODU04681.1 MAG: hypothetical protein ABS81_09265 [Pseudonocardia sp. SCN 72-86]
MASNPTAPSAELLRTLVEVGHTGSIAGAARVLGLTQQAVSGRIRSLEDAIGVSVLHRGISGSTLTDAGALITSWAGDVLAAHDRLAAGLLTLTATHPARLRVAASQTIAEVLLPGWLVRLRDAEQSAGRPPTAVDLLTENSAGVIDKVRRGEVELGFIETPVLPTGLQLDDLGVDELAVLVAPTHPWAQWERPVRLDELAAARLVTREPGSGTRDALEHIIHERLDRDPAPAQLELATPAAVRSAIRAGTAPGVLSRQVVRDDLVLGRLVLVPTDGEPLTRPLTAVRRHRIPGSVAEQLVAIAS